MKEWTEGVHYYLDERGLLVFTEKYHLERGYCCGYGCRHCPFDHANVPGNKPANEKQETKNRETQNDPSFGSAG